MTSFLAHHGVAAVFVLMAIDAVFPAASELVMLYGGALASGALTHKVDVLGSSETGFKAFLAIALAGTIGYLLGSIGGWAIGLYGGRPFLERRGRWFHLDTARLDRAERWFDRWEDWAVLVGRVTPVVRSFVSIPAGVFETPFLRYTVLTAIGSAIWCFAWAGAGWALGASWDGVHKDFRYVDYAVVVGIALLAAYIVLRRVRSITMARRASDSSR
jgi:membrane protein DedA with SNARE-associated domain